jgi:hypothetical protein
VHGDDTEVKVNERKSEMVNTSVSRGTFPFRMITH